MAGEPKEEENFHMEDGFEGGSQATATKRYFSKMYQETMCELLHGNIVIHPLVNAIIDTPQFQRLRNIKQLGMTYYVYPAASHNRFEHSLGTYHLAGKLSDILNGKREGSENERKEWEKEKLCVQIAGLCHDLGHGPFSHLWEVFLNRSGISWAHEDNSIKFFDLMLKEEIFNKHFSKKSCTDDRKPLIKERIKLKELFNLHGLYDKEIDLIKNLIMGKQAGSTPPDKHYLYQIISNKDNDIDVDKFDYISRDSKMLNLNVQFDMERIMLYSRIMDADGIKQICFRDKVYPNIADMFMARGMLHDKAYQHPKTKIIEEMFIDAMILASEKFKTLISTDPETIFQWTDHIFETILFGNDEDFTEAKKLLTRIAKRELYSLLLTKEITHTGTIKQKRLDETIKRIKIELLKKNQPAYKNLKEKDLGIILVEINIGKSNEVTPLGNVYVFEKPKLYLESRPKKCNLDESTSLMPVLNNTKYYFKKILKRKMFVIYKGEDQEVLSHLRDDIPMVEELRTLAKTTQ